MTGRVALSEGCPPRFPAGYCPRLPGTPRRPPRRRLGKHDLPAPLPR